MNVTPFINRLYFARRAKAIENYKGHAEELQMQVLRYLLIAASNTEWGKEHRYADIHSYEDFAARVGINTYEELKGYIQRMRQGEKNVLWRGKVNWYAKSSGTTNDKSKFIPVSKEGLKNVHYLGGTDCVASYLKINPKSKLFSGKSLILGGSHATSVTVSRSPSR